MHKVLVIGVGSIGERHVRCFLATRRAEVSIVEINESLRRQVAERYRVPAFATIDDALECRPEAAVIAAPAPAHVPLARQLVNAGLHVLIEKPLSITLEGIDRLRDEVAHRRTTAAVAYVCRVFPELVAMREAIISGRFGQPLELVAVCGQHFPTYRPAYRDIYYARHEAGGGAIQDALTHIFNAGEWLVGPITRLVADAGHLALPGVDVEDTAHVVARHGPVFASYALNQHQAPNEVTITVACEGGTARCEIHNQRWQWMTAPGGAWSEESFGPRERDVVFIAQANAFLDAVEGKAPPPCTLDEGVQTLKVNLAALGSVRSRAWKDL